MDIYNEEMLNDYIAENPLRFSEKRLSLVRRDFYEHKRGTVSDEFVDYVLWAEKSPARHEHFGDFLLPIIRDNSWSSILEVGCGETVLLAFGPEKSLILAESEQSFTVVNVLSGRDRLLAAGRQKHKAG